MINPMIINKNININNLFKDFEVEGDIKNEVYKHLKLMGFKCRKNVITESNGISQIGFIDIVAEKENKSYAIEIDNQTPRGRSLYKLDKCRYDEKIVLVRKAGIEPYNIGNIKVIPLKIKE